MLQVIGTLIEKNFESSSQHSIRNLIRYRMHKYDLCGNRDFTISSKVLECKPAVTEFLCRLCGAIENVELMLSLMPFFAFISFTRLGNEAHFFSLYKISSIKLTSQHSSKKDELRPWITWAKSLSRASKIDRQFPFSHANWLIYVNGRKKEPKRRRMSLQLNWVPFRKWARKAEKPSMHNANVL